MKKVMVLAGVLVLTAAALSGCKRAGEAAAPTEAEASKEPQTEKAGESASSGAAAEGEKAEAKAPDSRKITVAAAASLETCLREQLIPLFEQQNPGITVEGTYDSSGKLQTQIEEGADIDVFFPAATKQMDALKEEGMIKEGSVKNLLENKIVLIVPAGDESGISSFTDIVKADSIAIGDPDSVPVGQYSREALTNLGLWDEVLKKASLGTNVTEVLNWVAEGSAKAGIVYATDAAQTDKVTVVSEAPAGSVKKAIYPAGIILNSSNQEEAGKFIDFLGSDQAMKIFKENGFAKAE